jgi:hypothetical protein
MSAEALHTVARGTIGMDAAMVTGRLGFTQFS